jgi:hypothetical protein
MARRNGRGAWDRRRIMKRQSPECTRRNGNPAIPLRRGFFLVWLMQRPRPDTQAL